VLLVYETAGPEGHLKFTRQSTREDQAAHRETETVRDRGREQALSGDLQSVPLKFKLNINQHMFVEKPSEAIILKNYKGWKEQFLGSHRARNGSCFHQLEWYMYQSIMHSTQKSLASLMGKN
jgi:hypothetical protein